MIIEIVSGSPRTDSVTFRLALFLQKLFSEKTSHQVNLLDVRQYPFPLLQHVYTSAEKAPEELKPAAERIFAADAFILVTPEYNGSYSPAMKNMFDHFPKQMHKVFGIATASTGASGGMRATQQLQLMVNAFFGVCSPYMLVTAHVDKRFDASGNLLDGSFHANIDTFMAEFLWLAEKIKGK
ncbi:MAG TPA: NAD(P)H-dependent oxidoreductase [Sphingobacteriaceae bacterium]